MTNKSHIKKHLSTFQYIILGFALVILTGALLLMLPISSKSRTVTPFLDTLFTSTSAVCVTGLVVVDTATHWSLFGHIVILTLIQIGGLGVITVLASIALLSGRKIGLMQRSTMQEAMSAPKVGGIVKLLRFILATTFIFETAGAVAMMPVFCRDFGFLKGIWFSFFHSISAFCNAGFDLMGEVEPYSSLISYAGNPIITFSIVTMIVFGGLGFLTWADIKTYKFRLKRYSMQSKVIISSTFVLITVPTIIFFFFEFNDRPLLERFLCSLFQSVTPRTAGFNTVDLTTLSQTSQLIFIMLMLIGGSPGSTAGGMKNTTITVMLASTLSIFSRRNAPQCFKRRVSEEIVRHASAVFMMYLSLFLIGSLSISMIDGFPIMKCMFESASALGTVGSSLGITTELSTASRFIIIALMFLGRVGGITLIYSTYSGIRRNLSRLPQEKITVG